MECTRINFEAINIPESNFPPRDTWLKDIRYIGGYDVNGDYLGSDELAAQIPAAKYAKHISAPNAKTVMVHQLNYQVQGIHATRWRRCFVAHTYVGSGLKPILLLAAHSSQSVGYDGARQLCQPQEPDIEFSWPIDVVRDTGCFAVIPDRATFGWAPYDPMNAKDPIVDDVCAIDAAQWFINNMPLYKLCDEAKTLRLPLMKNILVGGLSYGAITAGFLLGALKDVEAGYLAGAYLATTIEGDPRFTPSEWITNGVLTYNYADMWMASNAKRICMSYGQGDYAYGGAPAAALLDSLVAWDATKFEWRISENPPAIQGHEIDKEHLRQWFSSRISDMVSGDTCMDMLKF